MSFGGVPPKSLPKAILCWSSLELLIPMDIDAEFPAIATGSWQDKKVPCLCPASILSQPFWSTVWLSGRM